MKIQESISHRRSSPASLAKCIHLRWTCALSFLVTLAASDLRASEELFQPPSPPERRDEVLLISTRKIGTVCNQKAMEEGLECRRILRDDRGRPVRASLDWKYLINSDSRPTIFYIHGNRVSTGHDLAEGLAFYRSFKRSRQFEGPVRFVIFSWPSGQIPGPIKDYLVKAERTNPVAWQLAWLLDRMKVDTPISLVGYSYGARVASGASHLLAGGAIGPLRLSKRIHTSRPPLRLALIAAAFDANWIQPGNYFARTLPQTERLIIGVNKLDPAMRFYHLSNGPGRMHALGKSGIYQPASIRRLATRVKQLDFSKPVGRSHVVTDYLAAVRQMNHVWRELMTPADQLSAMPRQAKNRPPADRKLMTISMR